MSWYFDVHAPDGIDETRLARFESHEFKEGTLHSGSRKGPRVTSRKQAVAIALSEARDAEDDQPQRPRSKPSRRKH